MFGFNLQELLLFIPIIIIALTFHEFSHGFVAYRLGDPTARNAGRLTLNPIKHLDLIGTLMMISPAHVGWARPVPLNPSYFKNKKKGLILVALAGPLSNILLAFAAMILWGLTEKLVIIGVINQYGPVASAILNYMRPFFYYFVIADINLAIFNMIPIPPLDGSRLLSAVMPEETYFRFSRYEMYIGLAFLLVVVFIPNALNFISYITEPIYNSFYAVTAFIFGL